jgi:hypothetical protein
VSARGYPACAYGPVMNRRPVAPRGLVGRSVVAALLFAAAVVPGWTLGDLAEAATGSALANWGVTFGWTALAVYLLAPHTSYRHRDAWQGLIPLWGWYLVCILAWRAALLPYRDWEPRPDELWRARWLTGDLVGYWRADPLPGPPPARVRAGSARADGRPST